MNTNWNWFHTIALVCSIGLLITVLLQLRVYSRRKLRHLPSTLSLWFVANNISYALYALSLALFPDNQHNTLDIIDTVLILACFVFLAFGFSEIKKKSSESSGSHPA
jgi:hypothetical protein